MIIKDHLYFEVDLLFNTLNLVNIQKGSAKIEIKTVIKPLNINIALYTCKDTVGQSSSLNHFMPYRGKITI